MKSNSAGILRLPQRSPVPSLLRRIGIVVGVILLVAILLYFARGGLKDNTHPGREMTFIDVLYFTVISLTTVGYGDIVPVTPSARFINAVLLTPIRILVLTAFIGTAYELILQRYREQVSMKQLEERLNNHSIVCGFGVKGRAIVNELLAHGHTLDSIVVIEPSDDAAQEATAMGLTALRGDASSESILRAAAIEKAEHILVAPHRDDECVLICLTVRALNPKVRLVASAREEENIKLLYRAGADVVVAPSLSGGRLMGAAVRQKEVTTFLQDLMFFGEGMDVSEYSIEADDAGKTVAQVVSLHAFMRNVLVIGVVRAKNASRLPNSLSSLCKPATSSSI
jgi:voltage-gated potassium channel